MVFRFRIPKVPAVPPINFKDLPDRDRIRAEICKLGNPLADQLQLELDMAWMIIREITGVKSAKYQGSIFFCHPECPPHYWDGKEMKELVLHPAPGDEK
jgi:hypothetical protein